MNDPERLIEHCDDEFVRALLAEGRRPVENKQRTLAVLAAVGAGGAVLSKAGWAAAATWKNAVAALLVVGSSAVVYELVAPQQHGVQSQAGDVTVAKRSLGAEPGLNVEPTLEPAQLDAVPVRQSEATLTNAARGPALDVAVGRATTRRARDVNVAAQGASTLSIEVSLLDKARAALRAGRPEQALTVLDKYSAEHPNGALQREAELVRIPALYQSGRRSEASLRAKRVLAKNPTSLVADQLKAYVSP